METEKSFVGMSNCFICGEVKELLLDRRLKPSLPQSAVYNKEPCDKCKKIMKVGILFVGVKNGEYEKAEDKNNPYRTGQIIGIKEDAFMQMPINKELKQEIFKKRLCYMEEDVLKQMGLINKNNTLKYKKDFKEE